MPNDSLPVPSVPSEPLNRDEILDLLKEDDEEVIGEEKEEKEESKKEEEKEEETKEEKGEEKEEIKLSEDETEKPNLEDVEFHVPVRRAEILQKYPKLFKDFPYLEKAMYRDQKWSEMFSTIEDAQEVIERSQILQDFEKDVLGGDISTVLSGIRKTDTNAFHKIVDNYLPTLAKVDNAAYIHIVGNEFKKVIASMAQEAQRLGENGDPLKHTALILHQYLFGTSNFEGPTNLAKPSEENKQKEELTRERREFIKERFDAAYESLSTKVNNTLTNTISEYIDPKGEMSDYVKRNAVRDANENLRSLIAQDDQFKRVFDKLWERAFQSNFSKDSLDKVRNAYLSKAKSLLREVIRKSRNDALKGKATTREEKDRKGPIPAGRSTSQPEKRTNTKPGEIPRKMTSLEFLMQD